MDGGAWWAAVHGVAKSRTRLSDFTFTFHFLHLLEMANALAFKGHCRIMLAGTFVSYLTFLQVNYCLSVTADVVALSRAAAVDLCPF